MFWKNDKIKLHSWSLVSKLMVLYTVSTLSIILSISIFLYPTLINIVSYLNTHLGEQLLEVCYKKIIIALLLSSLSAIVLGYIIAKNSMKKIREFSNKMELISANSLHERINPNDWPHELKSLGNKFNTMLDRLEVSFKKLSQFSSDIAHEIRTPIHNLKNITEFSLAKPRTVTEYIKLLESSLEEYHHLTKLIETLFFLAHVDHGKVIMKQSKISIKKEIDKLCDYFSAMAEEKDILIYCKGDGNLWGDLTLFKRMISNLLSNALKYSLHQGKIFIEISSTEHFIQISIIDTGVGIKQDDLPKLFDRFYRVDPSRAEQTGGLGLGLSIVKSIVNLHQGEIFIESQINVGTKVMISFPSSQIITE